VNLLRVCVLGYNSIVADAANASGVFGLYTSSNASMSDVSVGYVEPFGDPLQNFYATSTVERNQGMAYASSTSLETLDEFHRRGSMMGCSPGSTAGSLDHSVLFSMSPDVAPAVRDVNGHYTILATRSFPVESATNFNQIPSSLQHTGRRASGHMTHREARADLDSVDGVSVHADSGIESNAPSLRQISGTWNVAAAMRDVDVERRTSLVPPLKKKISHVRSASDTVSNASSFDTSAVSSKSVVL